MLTRLRRAIFTYIDVHSVEGCYRYYYLFGWEAIRFRASCSHTISYDVVGETNMPDSNFENYIIRGGKYYRVMLEMP